MARSLDGLAPDLADRWLIDVRARGTLWNEDLRAVLKDFFKLFASMLPASLTPQREHVDELWMRAAELLGSLAARRGLAVGEAIEEFQVLREVLIRGLHASSFTGRVSLRELLALNRTIDQGVIHTAVGHADALFFSLLGTGVMPAVDEEFIGQVTDQLQAVRTEFDAVRGSLPH